MGILNVTPDSFSDGGVYLEPNAALARAVEMVRQGATLIDVGGASSRPRGKAYGEGAAPVPAEEELSRVLPVVRGIAREIPGVLISVDTFHQEVAQEVIAQGAHMINDVTGLRDSPGLATVVADAGAGLVVMHSRGLVGSMPHEDEYTDVLSEVSQVLQEAAIKASSAGVKSLILDPGFGFGKSTRDNFRLIDQLDRFAALGYPVLIGVSRKSSIGIALASEDAPLAPAERLFGSLGATAVAVMRGASIVRTHDVTETVQMLSVMGQTLGASEGPLDTNPYLESYPRRPSPNSAST